MHEVTVLIGGHSRGNVSVVRDLGKSAGLLPELSFNSRFFWRATYSCHAGQRCSTSQSFISEDAILSKDTNCIRLNFCLDLMLKSSRIFPFDGMMQHGVFSFQFSVNIYSSNEEQTDIEHMNLNGVKPTLTAKPTSVYSSSQSLCNTASPIETKNTNYSCVLSEEGASCGPLTHTSVFLCRSRPLIR